MNILQRNDDWLTSRIGKITASRIGGINAKPKTGKALNETLLEILSERLTGEKTEGFTSKAMQWGIENEPYAVTAYENETGLFVMQTGLIDHPTIPMSGASPDGLVGKDGLIEIKCPTSPKHTNTLLTGQVPSEYMPQITWQLACTGRKWCDFVSYDPRQPEHLKIKIIRVNRDDEAIGELEQQVINANQILENAKKELGA
ncbi:exonuclease [Moraxella bovoculi]|uniref:Exonuclease n=1 Tax=Moraxella bovoculi TaxID=386891 RepID=A0AAC8PVD6_9GAMM|nr:lambda exonuclease family protein [Moraxella bovoculi]AKG07032.1 exonuclease [Moraxella bovoculi]AKG09018.1 exonuclease [Moraxella bovoculi]AKG14188.1 exonuclease [Moraxella bovoculi]